MLSDEIVADLVGKCTRLHIFASFRLAHLDESVFSQKMNTGFLYFFPINFLVFRKFIKNFANITSYI